MLEFPLLPITRVNFRVLEFPESVKQFWWQKLLILVIFHEKNFCSRILIGARFVLIMAWEKMWN